MKKFFLPLIVLVLSVPPVIAQGTASPEGASQGGVSQESVSQEKAAPQTDAQQPVSPEPTNAPAATAEPAAPAPASVPSAPEDKVIEEIVARVNNAIITRTDLRRNQEQIAFDTRDQKLSQSQIEERQTNALRDLIDQQLLIQRGAELGITADADMVKRLDEIRKQMKVETLEELQRVAESQGVRWEEFKKNTKNNILTQKVIGSEVGSRIQITREEAQKYYDEHKDEFTQPERVRLSEILVANDPTATSGAQMEATPEQVAAAEAKIKELYNQLKGGAKFEELARKESHGPTADQGGDLGYFKRNDLAKTLEEQTFKLKAGEYTPPIHTRQGFIILMVNDHIDAGTPPFERVREQIHERLYMQRVQPALREYLVKLRDDAFIDVKPGYTDTGASPNESKLVYATDSGPRTKEVRGKLGIGKKKTVLVDGDEKAEPSQAASGRSSALGQAKAEAVARENAGQDRKSPEDTAAAKAAAEAAEAEKMSHMSNNEKKKYLAQKKKREEKAAKEEAKRKRKEEQKQKELAAKEAESQAAEAKAAEKNKQAAAEKAAAETNTAENKKAEKKSKEAASGKTSETPASEQAESSQQQEKKKIHWF